MSVDPMFQFRVLSVRHKYKNHRFSLKFQKDGETNQTEIIDLNKSIIEFSVPYKEKESLCFEVLSDSAPILDTVEEDDENKSVEALSYKVNIDLSPYVVRGFKYRISHPLGDEHSSLEMRLVIKGERGILPEEKYPFYRMFHPNYQFMPLVREILSFLPHIDLLSHIHLVSRYVRRIIRNQFEFDLTLSGKFTLPSLFNGLQEFKVRSLVIKDCSHENLKVEDFGDFGKICEKKTEEEGEEEEEEEETKNSSSFCESLKELYFVLQDGFEYDIQFVQTLLDWFSNLEVLDLEGDYRGHIKLRQPEWSGSDNSSLSSLSF